MCPAPTQGRLVYGRRRLTFTKGSDGALGDGSMPDFTPDGPRSG